MRGVTTLIVLLREAFKESMPFEQRKLENWT
jgi:hypothetical protein